jgi:hypothetical protein
MQNSMYDPSLGSEKSPHLEQSCLNRSLRLRKPHKEALVPY